jgi:hypothetical protein
VDLKSLKKSVTEMTDDELKACILKERADRRNSGRVIKEKAAKAEGAKIKKAVTKLSAADIQELLDLIGD